MCHCLPKHFWWPYCYYYAMTLNWELITRDQIILPSLAHSSSPRKLSQLPQQMLSHQWEWSTPHFGMHIIYPHLSIYLLSSLPDKCWVAAEAAARRIWGKNVWGQNFHNSHPVLFSSVLFRNPLSTPPYHLTSQDLVLCVSSSLPASLPQAQFFGLAEKTVISIKMCSIFIGLTL